MMMSDTLTQGLSEMRTRLSRLQTELGTSRRLHRPSDHPAAAVDALRLRSALDRMDRYERNISEANSWLGVADGALGQLTEILQRVKELAVQGANGTLTPENMAVLAAEVDKLLSSAVDVGNTAHGQTYLFGGFRGDAPPFALAGGVVTYNGDVGQVMREIAPGTQLQINLPGSDLMAATDVFTAIKNLYDRLMAADNAGISQFSLTEVDNAIAGAVQLRASLGARQQQAEMMEQRSRDTRVSLETHLEIVEGVDMEKTMIDFNQADTAYRTALAVGARILPPSLVDFLR